MAEKSNRADADRMLGAYRDNESVLKAFLRRFTNNSHDVEDICQETVLRALEAVRSREILEPGPFCLAWRAISCATILRKSRAT